MFWNRKTTHDQGAAAQSPTREAQLAAAWADVEQVEAEFEPRLATLREATERAKAHALALHREWQTACTEHARVDLERTVLTNRRDHAVSKVFGRIDALADPRIDAFIDALDARRAALKITERSGFGPRNMQTGLRREIRSTNFDAVKIVIDAVDAARQRAQALKCERLDDVGAVIAELAATVPSVDDAEEQVRQSEESLQSAS